MSTLEEAKKIAYDYWADSDVNATWEEALDRAVELGAEAIRTIQMQDRRDYKKVDAECDELHAQLMRCAHILGIPEADTAYDVMTLHELCEIFMEAMVEVQELRARVKDLEEELLER